MKKEFFKYHLIVPLTLLTMSCVPAKKNDNLSQPKIRGGEETSENPAVVALYRGKSMEIDKIPPDFYCSGTLIAPNIVLTAAHCVVVQGNTISDGPFYIYTGSNLTDPAKRPEPTLVKEIHVDKDFNNYNNMEGRRLDRESHDIALLVLAKALAIKPIPYLKKPLTQEMLTRKARIIGFGANKGILNQKGSGVKRTTSVKINDLADNDYLSLGGIFNNICKGDSGGPILMEIDGVETVIGVNSFGPLGCLTTSHATRVDKYLEKIISPVVKTRMQQQPPAHVIKDELCKTRLAIRTCYKTSYPGFNAQWELRLKISSCVEERLMFRREEYNPFFNFSNQFDCEEFKREFNGLTLPTSKGEEETLTGGKIRTTTALLKYLRPVIKESAFIRSAFYTTKLCHLILQDNTGRKDPESDHSKRVVDLPIPACEELRNRFNQYARRAESREVPEVREVRRLPRPEEL